MENIKKIISRQSKLGRYQKPLGAAKICDIARSQASGRYQIVSFQNGLLTVGVSSNLAAANLQVESSEIIERINQKIGESKVERIRFKIE